MIERSYPGSLDNGAVDTEYTPRPEWRDLRTTDDLLADHERRIRSLERALARVLAAVPSAAQECTQ